MQPESAAREALLGERAAISRSQGEQLFVARAGADRADPLARYVVDDEFGDLAYKEKSFADTVMFWKKEAAAPLSDNAVMAATPKPVDAVTEAERVKALTGGKTIIIRQKKDTKLKLPGL